MHKILIFVSSMAPDRSRQVFHNTAIKPPTWYLRIASVAQPSEHVALAYRVRVQISSGVQISSVFGKGRVLSNSDNTSNSPSVTILSAIARINSLAAIYRLAEASGSRTGALPVRFVEREQLSETA